jgi:hypothetical protein
MWFGKNDNKWNEEYDGSVTQAKCTCLEDLEAKIKAAALKKELEEYFYTIVNDDED